jgi:hypothetical protein
MIFFYNNCSSIKITMKKFAIKLNLYFKPTQVNFDLKTYLESLNIKDFVDSISMYSGDILYESARLLENNSICFIIESSDSLDEIVKDISTVSLADSAYEGASGWVVMNQEKTQEIGLIDYKRNEIDIKII